ncbi:unnamed protein product [marine sediment metagenome]|uniref:Uncharacterized protein n=1 Tax=marine sediment metagenome TaxID=412755 RepID=X1PZ99_9ZZZZ
MLIHKGSQETPPQLLDIDELLIIEGDILPTPLPVPGDFLHRVRRLTILIQDLGLYYPKIGHQVVEMAMWL